MSIRIFGMFSAKSGVIERSYAAFAFVEANKVEAITSGKKLLPKQE